MCHLTCLFCPLWEWTATLTIAPCICIFAGQTQGWANEKNLVTPITYSHFTSTFNWTYLPLWWSASLSACVVITSLFSSQSSHWSKINPSYKYYLKQESEYNRFIISIRGIVKCIDLRHHEYQPACFLVFLITFNEVRKHKAILTGFYTPSIWLGYNIMTVL